MTDKFTSASVAIGITDETDSLCHNLGALMSACRPEDISEVILVAHSKTTPETMRIAQSYCEKYPEYHFIVYMQQGVGFGHILTETINMMTGSHFVCAAADNATDLALIGKFIEVAKREPNTVPCASRWINKGGFDGYGKLKMFLNHRFQRFIAAMFLSDCTDLSSPYQLTPIELFKSVRLTENGMALFIELRLKLIRLHTKFYEIPAVWHSRNEGKHVVRWLLLSSYFRVALKVRFMRRKDILISDTK